MAGSDFPSLSSLPHELLQTIFTNFCDGEMLQNIWHATSADRQIADMFWVLLNKVLDHHITRGQITDGTCQQDLENLSKSLFAINQDRCQRHRVFHQRLDIMKYTEHLTGVLWCGHMEFKDPMLPEWSAQTARVIVRCDTSHWSWNHAQAWNRSFSHTIKLFSQMYSFVPVQPRGHIFGVTSQDEAILKGVSFQLKSRDQVMTLRFGNTDGFILRVISPAQARQRLERFGGSKMAQFETFPDALVCSWEQYDDDETRDVSDSDMHRLIHCTVKKMEGMATTP